MDKRNVLYAVGLFAALLPLLFPVSASSAAVSGSPIKVHGCDPVQGTTTVAGYTPGYYPTYGPYYWRDPYGYRYHQFAYPSATVHTTSPTLNIAFTNVTPNPVKEVEFGLVARGQLIAEVRDVGTFTQGAEIKHKFGLNPNVFPIGTGLPQCVPLQVMHADGTVWTNPHLPKLRKNLYQE